MNELHYVLKEDPLAQIEDESKIHWQKNPAQFDYVRVSSRRAGTRQRGVDAPTGERIGYAILDSDADNSGRPGVFYRRVFWLKEHDRHNDPEGCYQGNCPSEAIDPRTVEPGQRGHRTDRVVSGYYPSLEDSQ